MRRTTRVVERKVPPNRHEWLKQSVDSQTRRSIAWTQNTSIQRFLKNSWICRSWYRLAAFSCGWSSLIKQSKWTKHSVLHEPRETSRRWLGRLHQENLGHSKVHRKSNVDYEPEIWYSCLGGDPNVEPTAHLLLQWMLLPFQLQWLRSSMSPKPIRAPNQQLSREKVHRKTWQC